MAAPIYKQFVPVRTVFYMLLAAFFMAFFLTIPAISHAETNPAYTVEGVEVDVTAENAVKAREKAMDDLMKVRQPSQQPIMPEHIAAYGVFLCSAAGAHINGAALPIDGAWQAGFSLTVGNKS